MRTFNDILQSVSYIKINNEKYYSFYSLYNQLNRLEEEIGLEDCILTPFYLCDAGILELYDYELNIRVVSHSNITQYSLGRTGKSNIEEIDENILNKLVSCYIEIGTDKKILPQQINEYINYILESDELRNRMLTYLSEFDKEKLYFEVY